MRIDWVQAKTDYVTNPALTLEDVAQKYGTTKGTVSSRAATDKWTQERRERNRIFQAKASKKNITNAVEELQRQNAADLDAATKLRALILKKIAKVQKTEPESKDVRQLAGALESVQRVVHLALGAATELTGQGIDSVDLTKLSDDEFTSIESLLAKASPGGTQAAQC